MAMSVSPILCVTVARWLARGIFNSVAWLPFLNCAPAFPASAPHPTKIARTHFDTLRMIESPPLKMDLPENRAGLTPHSFDGRPERRRVSKAGLVIRDSGTEISGGSGGLAVAGRFVGFLSELRCGWRVAKVPPQSGPTFAFASEGSRKPGCFARDHRPPQEAGHQKQYRPPLAH